MAKLPHQVVRDRKKQIIQSGMSEALKMNAQGYSDKEIEAHLNEAVDCFGKNSKTKLYVESGMTALKSLPKSRKVRI